LAGGDRGTPPVFSDHFQHSQFAPASAINFGKELSLDLTKHKHDLEHVLTRNARAIFSCQRKQFNKMARA
jgi:hypothetical protein